MNTKKHCIGCNDNFYNSNNPYKIKTCWHLESARLIKRKKVGINDVPPWTWKPKKFLSCYSQTGYGFINCEKEDRQY